MELRANEIQIKEMYVKLFTSENQWNGEIKFCNDSRLFYRVWKSKREVVRSVTDGTFHASVGYNNKQHTLQVERESVLQFGVHKFSDPWSHKLDRCAVLMPILQPDSTAWSHAWFVFAVRYMFIVLEHIKYLHIYIYCTNLILITRTPDDGGRDGLRNDRHQLHIDTAHRPRRLHCVLFPRELQVRAS
jgi:hypothetical protein